MNKVIFMGRLVADPEFSMTQTGKALCRFRIAVDRPVSKNNQQNGQEQADFFRVTCWEKTAETVSRYFVKGKPVLLEGRVQNNNYTDNNGVQHYGVDIIADRVEFLLSDPTRNAGGNNGYQNGGYNNGGYNNYNNGGYNNGYNNGGYNNGYNNGGYNNGGYQGNQFNNGGNFQNNQGNQPPYQQAPQNYDNQPPAQPAPAQDAAPTAQPPKDIQLGNGDSLKDFDVLSDGDVPF